MERVMLFTDLCVEDVEEKIKKNVKILDLITGEDNTDDERGTVLDNARFYIYEEIFCNRVNDDNFADYIELYKRLSEDDVSSEDNGQISFAAIS